MNALLGLNKLDIYGFKNNFRSTLDVLITMSETYDSTENCVSCGSKCTAMQFCGIYHTIYSTRRLYVNENSMACELF